MSLNGLALIVKLSDLHTMAKRSDIVVHGYIGEQRVITDELGRLITLTDIEVIEGLYGAKNGEIVTVYQVGGQKNGVVMPLIGGHLYQVHEELILFGLKLDDAYVSYGAGQGKFDIIKNEKDEHVIEDLGDIEIVQNAMGNNTLMRPIPLSFPSKTTIKEEIKEMIKFR
jgi:hypothetical protein